MLLCRTCLQVFSDEQSLEKHKAETDHGKKGRKEIPLRCEVMPEEQNLERHVHETLSAGQDANAVDLSTHPVDSSTKSLGLSENSNLTDNLTSKSASFINAGINSRLLFPDLASFPIANPLQNMGTFPTEIAPPVPKDVKQYLQKVAPAQVMGSFPREGAPAGDMVQLPHKVAPDQDMNMLPPEVESFINENSRATSDRLPQESENHSMDSSSRNPDAITTQDFIHDSGSSVNNMNESVESMEDRMDLVEDSKASLRDLVSPGDVGLGRAPAYGPGVYISGDLIPATNIKSEPLDFKQGEFIMKLDRTINLLSLY